MNITLIIIITISMPGSKKLNILRGKANDEDKSY